ncbi:MAG: DivIVA domain-containing protein [Anaerorhabdus sp.]
MSRKINLTLQAIFDKQFSIDFKGYCASEVDSFLDLILEDVETYLSTLEEMSQKVDGLEKNNAMLREQVLELEARARAKDDEPKESVSQLDLIKRLSRLEQAVYGNRSK